MYVLQTMLLLSCAPGAVGEVCIDTVCNYEFVLGYSYTMDYRGYDVQVNGTGDGYVIVTDDPFLQLHDPLIGQTVQPDLIIPADGHKRTVITVNGKFPGPNIEVLQGSIVVVKVVNRLDHDCVTIHWHGMRMQGTPWMDGVADLTQCAILPSQTFTYTFSAEPAGTHWYHSHMPAQYQYGLHGLIVVHAELPSLPYHLVTVGDWFKVQDIPQHSRLPISRRSLPYGVTASIDKWESALINGRGHADTSANNIPLSVFKVGQNRRYRFRMANVGTEYALVVSIDNHQLTVVATDGYEIRPMTSMDYITIHVSETVDFELDTDQEPGRFWMRARSHEAKERNHEVRAILEYDGDDNDDHNPTSLPQNCTQRAPCKVFNCGFQNYPISYNMTCINLHEAVSTLPQDEISKRFGLNEENVQEIFLNMGQFQAPVPVHFNGKNYVSPSAPRYQADSRVTDCSQVCGDPDGGCRCTHTVKLGYMQTVRFIISNFKREWNDFNHPVHLHGHDLALLHMGHPRLDEIAGVIIDKNEDVECTDHLCTQPRWNSSKPTRVYDMSAVRVKNTLAVPAGGYAVVQFIADNPGYWLLHCHLASHINSGLALLIEEALEHVDPPPAGFPTCYDYVP